MPTALLQSLLKDRFGFDTFRPSQEMVCQAVAQKKDVLLVMPTGAGKSLCYQLPGIALGGTTLVISPLLALIDDQVSKLRTLGLRTEQIHSGRSREDARNACHKYLRGELDFLFIAPERLAVPGFIEMLAKRKPTLIAIDEAHCISQWGHDFRPEYRRLGERLTSLRPAPFVALTATATPAVQEDITKQLQMSEPHKFIQGFRRTNIAIQVHEVSVPDRARACEVLLAQDVPAGRLPAIVYAPTRKSADEIAQHLSKKFGARSYHAGMTPAQREQVQTQFLNSKLQVIVATIAFGMGIDKANVRTVIHAGLPGSVEGYYQEIGRAGRDGLESSAILMHSFADQKTHSFFFERDYPKIEILENIYKTLLQSKTKKWDSHELERKMGSKGIEPEVYSKAIEKLWIHGGVTITHETLPENGQYGEWITAADAPWQRTYPRQLDHRTASLDKIVRFTSEPQKCRMLMLINHFGDKTDSQKSCNTCDRCLNATQTQDPSLSRPLSNSEQQIITLVLTAAHDSPLSVGRLLDQVTSLAKSTSLRRIDRKELESLLEVLSQKRWIKFTQDAFEKDGKTISYRRVEVLNAGKTVRANDIQALTMSVTPWNMGNLGSMGNSGLTPMSGTTKKQKRKKSSNSVSAENNPSNSPMDASRLDQLKQWRLTKARQKGIPAFRILSDRVLQSLTLARPTSLDDLMEVSGFGPKLRDQYGSELLQFFTNTD